MHHNVSQDSQRSDEMSQRSDENCRKDLMDKIQMPASAYEKNGAVPDLQHNFAHAAARVGY